MLLLASNVWEMRSIISLLAVMGRQGALLLHPTARQGLIYINFIEMMVIPSKKVRIGATHQVDDIRGLIYTTILEEGNDCMKIRVH